MKITAFLITLLLIFLTIWFTPVRSYLYWSFAGDIQIDTLNLPFKNKQVISLIERKGKQLAPSYQKVVCTEYVINVLEHFSPLSETDKTKIRIITTKDLNHLISTDSNIIKGVCYYLTSSKKGAPVSDIKEAKAGDFIQFWNTRFGKTTGHCGIIRAIDTDNGLISLYSSSPSTDGFGKQLYWIPDKFYIARIKQ